VNRVVDLGGRGWELRGCLGESWRWYVEPGRPAGEPGWLPARVPGSVVDDLWRAGELADPYHERNSLLAEWVPARAWVYRRPIELASLGEGERATLVFSGVDHAASVLVDGIEVGGHHGCFTSFEIDVTPQLQRGGTHLLAVVVHPAPPSEPQVGDSSRVRVHKSRMGYGWDFCPRLVHLGIWRPVELWTGAAPFRPRPSVRLDEAGRGVVVVEGAERLSLVDADEVVAEAEGSRLTIEAPSRWWPNGAGPQRRYRLRAERGGARDERLVGFCRVELVDNPGAPAGARPYTVAVNGRPQFLRGWNWVPLDACYGVPRPAKLAHLLELAAGSGANCLRVWGGGLLESDEFYDHCDRLGLLVWQEFALSSSGFRSVPNAEPGYLEMMAAEAPAIVRDRRWRPSLAIWCGGNELAARAEGRDDVPLDESTPVIAVLAAAVAEHDPGRPFLPTSPSGPRFLNRLDLVLADPEGQHDVHGPWEHQGLEEHNVLYDGGTCLLHSEVGVEGMANRRSLERLIGPAHRWPADRSNPVYAHLGAWWNNADLVQRCFGGRLQDLEPLRRASQQLQYDGLRYAVESRLRHAPRTSGVLPWQLAESYPNAWCTAAIDWLGDPKPAWYGVRRAYRPVHACASFPTWAWGGRPELAAVVSAWGGEGEVTARLLDVAGRVVAEERFTLAPGAPGATALEPAGELAAPAAAFSRNLALLDLVVTLDDGRRAANSYLLSTAADLAPLLDLDPADVACTLEDGAVVLRHLGGMAVPGLVLEDGRPADEPGWAVFGDNMIDLLPGEERRIALSWRDAPEAGRRVRVSGWNLAAVCLP
jgi:beta-mannosidase